MVRQRLLYYAALLSLTLSICAGAESTPSTPSDTSANKEDLVIVPSGCAVSRSKEGVEALIEKEGSTPPGWWEEVKLNIPPDLDLTWANPTPGNNQNQNKFLMMYIWNVINTNPGKWKEGIKLLSHSMTVNKDNQARLKMSMNALAKMYHDFLQDYARAAYWWRKAGSTGTGNEPSGLADCYYRLGNRDMAVEVLQKSGGNNWFSARLWSDIGEYDKALGMLQPLMKQNQPGMSQWINLLAGDICRSAGRFKEAASYYETAATPGKINQEMITRKARANAETLRVYELLDLSKIADGTYSGEGQGYCSMVKVSIEVKAAKIANVNIVQHHEKQYYGSLVEMPRRIIEKQGLKGVDTFSSATMTSEGIITASAKALSGAMK